LLACLGAASQSANAQIPVTDGASIAENIAQYAAEAKQWVADNAQYAKDFAKQEEQFQQQITQYQSTLSKFSSILDGVKFLVPEGVPLTSVGADYLVEESCPTTTAGVVSSLIGMLPSLNLSGEANIDFRKKQHEICTAMQQTRNKKFNASLEFLNKTMPDIEALHAQMEARHNETKESGQAFANIDDGNLAQQKVDDAVKRYELRVNGYDQYLATLQQSQVTLAQIALKGRRATAMRSMVSNAALMEGLDVSPDEVLP
jgi:hypothetical protein